MLVGTGELAKEYFKDPAKTFLQEPSISGGAGVGATVFKSITKSTGQVGLKTVALATGAAVVAASLLGGQKQQQDQTTSAAAQQELKTQAQLDQMVKLYAQQQGAGATTTNTQESTTTTTTDYRITAGGGVQIGGITPTSEQRSQPIIIQPTQQSIDPTLIAALSQKQEPSVVIVQQPEQKAEQTGSSSWILIAVAAIAALAFLEKK